MGWARAWAGGVCGHSNMLHGCSGQCHYGTDDDLQASSNVAKLRLLIGLALAAAQMQYGAFKLPKGCGKKAERGSLDCPGY